VREFGGLKLGPLGVSSSSRFDLVLFINDPESAPHAAWVYNPNLFEASTIARFATLYEALLRAVAADPELSMGALAQRLAEAEAQIQAEDRRQFQQASARKLKDLRRGAKPSPVASS
jgi:non-ribosomal peptide synthetase component F